MRIVLASASEGRKKILESLKIPFQVIPANIDERKITASNPITLVKKIAKEKAETVVHKLKWEMRSEKLEISSQEISLQNPASHIQFLTSRDLLVIAADSMVLFRGKTYGKPKSKAEAIKMLTMLSGQTHEFITGVCIIRHCEPEGRGNLNVKIASSQAPRNDVIVSSCKSLVTFDKFSREEIDRYVEIADVTKFAGGFAPDLKGGELIKPKMHIKGSVSNVLGGLPLKIIKPILARYS